MPNLSYGTYLQIAGVNNVASLTDIQGLDIKTNTVDVTNLGSAALFKEFMAGFKEVSDLTLTGFFRPDDTLGQMQLWSLLNSGAVTAFSIVFPFGASWNFNGIVTGFKTDAKTEDVTPFDGTVKITGAPTLNVTPSSGLSGLTSTAGALTPIFANGTTSYTVTATTPTVTVTPTATGTITVNGQGVTSGSASQSINITSGAVTPITITETDSGKVPKTYTIYVAHA
jgi:predicted secreted protein